MNITQKMNHPEYKGTGHMGGPCEYDWPFHKEKSPDQCFKRDRGNEMARMSQQTPPGHGFESQVSLSFTLKCSSNRTAP